ncbi:putative holin-like toxin [Enterococcus sp. DIV0242_7C1]|nr:putative holin-like toxin [Enterococcus sp. 9D6_DIV0238]MBO0471963.1 putative holin-like toxin [Enterococcus sp. DIV0242_7C1]
MEYLLSALEAIQLILSFGMFTIALIKLIVELLKDKKTSSLAKQ